MECMWTTLRYRTYPATSPPVKCVTVQIPHQLPEASEISDMLRYFHRPPELHHLRFTELFARFKVEKKSPRYSQAEHHEPYSTPIKDVFHHYSRPRNDDKIVSSL